MYFRENHVITLREEARADIVTGSEVFRPEGAEGAVVLYMVVLTTPWLMRLSFHFGTKRFCAGYSKCMLGKQSMIAPLA